MIWHPALLAIYPVLFVAHYNQGQAEWVMVLLMLLVALLVAGGFGAGAWLGHRSSADVSVAKRVALTVSIWVVLFYLYGPLVSGLEQLKWTLAKNGYKWARPVYESIHWILTPLWGILAGLSLKWVRRLPVAKLEAWNEALNRVSVVLIVMVTIQLATSAFQDVGGETSARESSSVQATQSEGTDSEGVDQKPDIYTIILDGYARRDVLKKYYSFDNGEFYRELEKRGFQISENSYANYNQTYLSLSSLLNFNYLQDQFDPPLDKKTNNRFRVYESIRKNQVAKFLKTQGYRFVHFHSTWGATKRNPYADERVQCPSEEWGHPFVRVMMEASWFRVFQDQASVNLAECHLYNLKRLGEMGREPGPKFIFLHMIPPHHPYLFDEGGNVLRNATLSDQFEFQKMLWLDQSAYLSQMKFLNRKVLEAFDHILRDSKVPPIIVLMSDHGPNYGVGMSRKEYQRVRLANFAALRTPGVEGKLLGESPVSVNVFRLLLNQYFDAGLELLPQKHYFSKMSRPYRFKDVTHVTEVSSADQR